MTGGHPGGHMPALYILMGRRTFCAAAGRQHGLAALCNGWLAHDITGQGQVNNFLKPDGIVTCS